VKYIVMECHKGYAVLMDEDSVFVNAANLGYEVGQTVTDPVLMESSTGEVRRKNRIVMTLAAAAACLMVMCGAGYHYYSVNYKTHSTVIISSNAGVKMYLNKKDEVIKLESISPEGEAILSDYSGKGKDKSDAISDILEIGKSKGYISDGDTVSVYIPDSSSLREEIEEDFADKSLKADVQPIEDYSAPAKPGAEHGKAQPPEPPEPPAEKDGAKHEPPSPEDATHPTAPTPPEDPSAPDKLPEPPKPPAEDGGIKPEPPKAPDLPGEAAPPDGVPAPDDPAKRAGEEPRPPEIKMPHETEKTHNKAELVAPVLPDKKAAPEVLL